MAKKGKKDNKKKSDSIYMPGFCNLRQFSEGKIEKPSRLKFSFIELNINYTELKKLLKKHDELTVSKEYDGKEYDAITIKLIPSTSKDAKSELFAVLEEPYVGESKGKKKKKKKK